MANAIKTDAFDEQGRKIEAELIPPKKKRRGIMKIRRVAVRVKKAAQNPLSKLFVAACLDVAKGVARNLGKR